MLLQAFRYQCSFHYQNGLMQVAKRLLSIQFPSFFKALLFLGAGAVIYACHHEQDIWKMGGLLRLMPVTAITFLIGTAALAGLPPLSGFWSKDAVMAAAQNNTLLLVVGAITAFLTAFYMSRLCTIVFFGKSRSVAAREASEVPLVLSLIHI